jgi:hypothetical protein
MSFAMISSAFPNYPKNQPRTNTNNVSGIYDSKLYQTGAPITPVPVQKIIPVSNGYLDGNNHYQTQSRNIEKLENTEPSSDYAQILMHLDFVLNNDICKEILMKKLNINGNFFSQEVIELISFILFGIFIIFILDRMRF